MERKLLYGEFIFVQIQTVKNLITSLRLCCSLRDILVACREIGSLSEQVKQTANLRDYNALVIGFPEGGGGPRADVGTLLIVHFKVLVFPHPCGLFFLQSPHYLAKPSTQLDLKMHF